MHDRDKGRIYPDCEMSMIIGSVPYHNAIPLTLAMKQPVKKFTPAQLVDALLKGEIDVGLIPVYSAVRNGWHLYPEAGLIGCDGEIKSVGFFIKEQVKDLGEIQTISFDQDSKTGRNLARLMFKMRYGKDLRTVREIPFENSYEADAKLLIGDKALFFSEPGYRYEDLGKLWKQAMGLGFVFACWTAKRPLTEIEIQILKNAKRDSQKHLEDYLKTLDPKEEKILRDYFQSYVVYEFTPPVEKGLYKYMEYLIKHDF